MLIWKTLQDLLSKSIKEKNSIPRMVPSVYPANNYYTRGNMPTVAGNSAESLLLEGG